MSFRRFLICTDLFGPPTDTLEKLKSGPRTQFKKNDVN
jgi:hypothetical protein